MASAINLPSCVFLLREYSADFSEVLSARTASTTSPASVYCSAMSNGAVIPEQGRNLIGFTCLQIFRPRRGTANGTSRRVSARTPPPPEGGHRHSQISHRAKRHSANARNKLYEYNMYTVTILSPYLDEEKRRRRRAKRVGSRLNSRSGRCCGAACWRRSGGSSSPSGVKAAACLRFIGFELAVGH